MKVSNKYSNIDRFKFFAELCKGKNVLHIGFVDWPITNRNQNMHLQIDKVAKDLVGIDPNISAFDEYKSLLVHQEMYSGYEAVRGRHFELVIVPEVIEHVGNVQEFLSDIDGLTFDSLYITAPDAMLLKNNFSYNPLKEDYTETVHPDHNCWYTPYTLKNTVQKYTNLSVNDLYYLGESSIMAVVRNEK